MDFLSEPTYRGEPLRSRIIFEGENTFNTVTLANNTSGVRVPMGTVVKDTHSAWSAANNWYTIPATDDYVVRIHLRLADGTTAGQNYGIGVETDDGGAHFEWDMTGGVRDDISQLRPAAFAAGDKVRFGAYLAFSGATTPIWYAYMQIIRL